MADAVEKKDYYREDEINLYDYMLVLWKRKFLIITIFVVAVISAAVISLRLPPVYRVTALLSPGQISQGAPVDSVVNIQSSITSGAFNQKIIDALNLDRDKYTGMGFKADILKGSDIININYDTPDPETGKKIMAELLKQLVESYRNRTDAGTEAVSKTVDILKNKIVPAENAKIQIVNEKKKIISDIDNKQTRIDNDKKRILSDITLLNDKIVLLKATEKALNGQIKETNENIKIIMHDRSEILKKGEKTESVALLMYSNTIQQNLSYIDRLNADLDRNKIEQEAAKNELAKKEIALSDLDTVIKDNEAEKETTLKKKDLELKNTDREISSINREIEGLKFQKAQVEGVRILQEAFSSVKPVKPQKIKIVVLAGVASLFVGILLAFFTEYLSKMRTTAKQ